MGKGIFTLALAALTALPVLADAARAATFTASVVDQDGAPVANAVVALIPDSKSGPAPSSRLPADKVIDQRDETFIPLVTIIPRGGHIVFANNDKTTHQVYSFSPIKQFEITLPQGEKSAPFTFDRPGVAALGCNIHDHMIAYVYVAESPWTGITDKDGRVAIAGVPDGAYDARLWHPQLPPARDPPHAPTVISGDAGTLAFMVSLLPPPPMHMAHSHAGHY